MVIIRNSKNQAINLGALSSIAQGIQDFREMEERKAQEAQAAKENLQQLMLEKMKMRATQEAVKQEDATRRDLARLKQKQVADAETWDREEFSKEQEWEREKLRITEEGRNQRQIEAIKAGRAKAGEATQEKGEAEARKRRKTLFEEEDKATEAAIKSDPEILRTKRVQAGAQKGINEINTRLRKLQREEAGGFLADATGVADEVQQLQALAQKYAKQREDAAETEFMREQAIRGYKYPFADSAMGVGAEEVSTPPFHESDIDQISQNVSDIIDEMRGTRPSGAFQPPPEGLERETRIPPPGFGFVPKDQLDPRYAETMEAVKQQEQLAIQRRAERKQKYSKHAPLYKQHESWGEIAGVSRDLMDNYDAFRLHALTRTEGTAKMRGTFRGIDYPVYDQVTKARRNLTKAMWEPLSDAEKAQIKKNNPEFYKAFTQYVYLNEKDYKATIKRFATIAKKQEKLAPSHIKYSDPNNLGVRVYVHPREADEAAIAAGLLKGVTLGFLDREFLSDVSGVPMDELMARSPFGSIYENTAGLVAALATFGITAKGTKAVLAGLGAGNMGAKGFNAIHFMLRGLPRNTKDLVKGWGYEGGLREFIIKEGMAGVMGLALPNLKSGRLRAYVRTVFQAGASGVGITVAEQRLLGQQLDMGTAVSNGIFLALLTAVHGSKHRKMTLEAKEFLHQNFLKARYAQARTRFGKAGADKHWSISEDGIVVPKSDLAKAEFTRFSQTITGLHKDADIKEAFKRMGQYWKQIYPQAKPTKMPTAIREPTPTPTEKPTIQPTRLEKVPVKAKPVVAPKKVVTKPTPTKPALVEKVPKKQPWEMTQKEYALPLIERAYGKPKYVPTITKEARFEQAKLKKRKETFTSKTIQRHHDLIRDAILAGRKIPTDVLADYGNLDRMAREKGLVEKPTPTERDLVRKQISLPTPLAPFEAIQQGQKVKYPKGTTHVRVNGRTKVLVKDVPATLKLEPGDKPYTTIEYLNVPKTGKAEVLETLKPPKAVQERIEAKIPLKPVPRKEDGFISFGRGEDKPVGPANLALDKKIRDALSAAHGVPKTGILTNLKDKATDVGHSLTRTFTQLPKRSKKVIAGKTEIVDFNQAIDELRRGLDDYQIARRYAHQDVRRATQNIEKNPEDLALFAETPIRDMAHEARRRMELEGSEGAETLMPFGLKVKDVLEMEKTFNEKVKGNPRVEEAIKARRAVRQEVADALIEEEILKETQVYELDEKGNRVGMKNEDYMHHIVLDYAEVKLRAAANKLRKPHPGYARGRKENIKAYNVALHEADLYSLTRALYDLRREQRAKRIIDHYEITDRLRNMTKQWNKQNPDKPKKTWKAFLPEGYEVYQHDPGRAFFHARTIPEQVYDEMLESSPYISRELLDKVREGIVLGRKKREVALPSELIRTIADITTPNIDSAIKTVAKLMTTNWKEWVLINPYRAFRYNWQNNLGDFDGMIAATPRILKHLPRTIKELNKFYRGEVAADWLEEGFDKSILSSTLTQEEIPSLNLMNIIEGKAANWNLLRRYLNRMGKYTTYRENVLRVAAWSFYRERYLAGDYSNIGISLRKDVMAQSGPLERAAKVAREAIGDYGATAQATKELRSTMFPFLSFIDVNFWRYMKAFHNIPTEAVYAYIKAREEGGDLSHSIGGAGKAGAKAGVKAGVGVSVAATKGIIKATKAGIAIMFLSALQQAWNQWRDPEGEALLGDYDRRRGHIALGDGKILRGQTAFQEFMEWFGMNDVISSLEDFRNGLLNTNDMTKKIVRATPNKFVNAVNPFLKLGVESITGVQFFPNAFDRKTSSERSFMRRLTRGFARMYSVENEWKLMTKLVPWIEPEPALPYWKSWGKAFVTSFDKEEAAYNHLLRRKYEYLDKIGRGQKTLMRTEASLAYLNLKKSIRYKDKTAEAYYRQKLIKLGKGREGFKKSLEWTKPLGGLAKLKRGPGSRSHFVSTLTEAERKKFLPMANTYFKETYIRKQPTETKPAIRDWIRQVY